MKRAILHFALIVLCLLFIPQITFASDLSSKYTKISEYSSNGLKIISFSTEWNDASKLRTIYDELLKNLHGDEISLLSCIYLYPDAHENKHGEYYSRLLTDNNGRSSVAPDRYINLYNCNKRTTVKELARTISHEYGHHFTCYYMVKYENKSFDTPGTLYQNVRGLSNNPDINNGTHEWTLSEIAAEDYVQYFGSPTCKETYMFYDITDYYKKKESQKDGLSSDIFNLCPQENTNILLAANIIKAREYWLNAFKYSGQSFELPPPPSYIYFDSVNTIDTSDYDTKNDLPGMGRNVYNIKLRWTPSETDTKKDLEYTVVAYTSSPEDGPIPVKTVSSGSDLSAIVGYYESNDTLYTDGIFSLKTDSLNFIVFTKDKSGNIVGSNLLNLDIKNLPDISAKTIRSSGSQNINVLFHGSFIGFTDARPVIIEGRTMVPFRKIFEELGADVSWNALDGTITAKNDSTEIQLKIGSTTAFCNNIPVKLDVAPQILNSRTIIPLRFISESMGNSVDWDSVEKVVTIK